MEKPDWDAIAAAYVEGAESMRAVARRFGVPLTTLRGHAQRERWEQRRRARQFEALAQERAAGDGGEAIFRLTDKLVRRAEELVDGGAEINARELGELMRALKGAKEIRMLRSALDEREQAARVRALEEKNAPPDNVLRIEFGPGTEEAAQ